jgi:hypothetical protein
VRTIRGFLLLRPAFSNDLAVTHEYSNRLAEKQPPNEILAKRL